MGVIDRVFKLIFELSSTRVHTFFDGFSSENLSPWSGPDNRHFYLEKGILAGFRQNSNYGNSAKIKKNPVISLN